MAVEEGFQDELKVLKIIKAIITEYCSKIIKQQLEKYGFLEIPDDVFDNVLKIKPLHIPKFGKWSEAFTVDPHRCMSIGINPFALHIALGLKRHPYFCEQLMKLPPEKRFMNAINLESVKIPKDSQSNALFPDIFCSTPDATYGVPHKTWFPPGLEIRENLEKWEGIFQSGKSQGILSRLEKSGNFAQNTGKTGKFE